MPEKLAIERFEKELQLDASCAPVRRVEEHREPETRSAGGPAGPAARRPTAPLRKRPAVGRQTMPACSSAYSRSRCTLFVSRTGFRSSETTAPGSVKRKALARRVA